MFHIIIPPLLYSLYNWNKNVLYHCLCIKDYGIKVSFEIMSLNVMLFYLINYMLNQTLFWMSPCIKRFHWVFDILLWPSYTQSLVSLRSFLWYMPQNFIWYIYFFFLLSYLFIDISGDLRQTCIPYNLCTIWRCSLSECFGQCLKLHNIKYVSNMEIYCTQENKN